MKHRLVRVSAGTAIVLGLAKGWLSARPSTAYLLTYVEGRCRANCAFCPQARDSYSSLEMLSRVEWPAYPIDVVVEKVKGALRSKLLARACIQVVNRPEAIEQALWLAERLSEGGLNPVSVSTPPLSLEGFKRLKEAGVERASVALDACSEEVFEEVKGSRAGGPYSWRSHWEALDRALKVFGPGRVSTHLIVGLGEREIDLARTVAKLVEMGVTPALFAFTPIPGTKLEGKPQPSLASYRRAQLLRFLLVNRLASLDDFSFNQHGELIEVRIKEQALEAVKSGEPFKTSGCPGCNRPFYNERPSGPIYNYPRPLSRVEAEEALRVLEDTIKIS
ncbi:MAG: radical SAM protein [Thermoprotei archaeon]|nr:MAG: radical SAM protein [Thermoprotei archaeon]